MVTTDIHNNSHSRNTTSAIGVIGLAGLRCTQRFSKAFAKLHVMAMCCAIQGLHIVGLHVWCAFVWVCVCVRICVRVLKWTCGAVSLPVKEPTSQTYVKQKKNLRCSF